MSARTNPGIAATALMLAFWVSLATMAEAQVLKVKQGDTVWMTNAAGRQAEGVVQGVGPSALTVLVSGREEQWTLSDTREIWRRGDSLRNGVLVGLLAGAGAGLLGGLGVSASSFGEGGNPAPALAGMTALGAAGGAALGAWFDSMRQGRTLVHRNTAAAVRVTPTVSRDARGVQVAVRF